MANDQGKKGWTPPDRPTSIILTSTALEVKARIQRGMTTQDVEVMTQACRAILN